MVYEKPLVPLSIVPQLKGTFIRYRVCNSIVQDASEESGEMQPRAGLVSSGKIWPSVAPCRRQNGPELGVVRSLRSTGCDRNDAVVNWSLRSGVPKAMMSSCDKSSWWFLTGDFFDQVRTEERSRHVTDESRQFQNNVVTSGSAATVNPASTGCTSMQQ